MIHSIITPDPKTITKQASVSTCSASNTSECAQVYPLRRTKITTVNEVFTAMSNGPIEWTRPL